LATFIGASSQGKWTLSICDGGQIGFGSLADWSITLNSGAASCPCPGDVFPTDVHDGQVNIDDLVLVITHWNDASGPADANHDDVVDMDDLLAVIMDWGACP
jgi:hypothetical protein